MHVWMLGGQIWRQKGISSLQNQRRWSLIMNIKGVKLSIRDGRKRISRTIFLEQSTFPLNCWCRMVNDLCSTLSLGLVDWRMLLLILYIVHFRGVLLGLWHSRNVESEGSESGWWSIIDHLLIERIDLCGGVFLSGYGWFGKDICVRPRHVSSLCIYPLYWSPNSLHLVWRHL